MKMDDCRIETGEESWDLVIKPKSDWFDINFRELWQSRELILLFVKRDFVIFYKQSILGPLWYLIKPLFMTLIFTIVFGRFARMSTDGIPHILFYMSGIVIWRFFAECLSKTANTFIDNADIFGKVYFPRLAIPVTHVIINFIQFVIQFVLFLCFYIYYIMQGTPVYFGYWIFYFPLIMVEIALLGVGTGILISSMTAKYKDVIFAFDLFVQLWMYATPIIYPLSLVPEKFHILYSLNPMVAIVESFRSIFLGVSSVQPIHIITSWAVTLIILFWGIILFNRVGKTFIDTV